MSEKRDLGAVDSGIYIYYMKKAGVVRSVIILLMYMLTVFGTYAVNYWVGVWMLDKFGFSRSKYILIYLGLGTATCISAVVQSYLLGDISKSASLHIYKNINWNILRRPMRFFDTTPSGVIMNRCINDLA